MTTKTRPRSRILAAMHETAIDMYRLGFISKRKMDRFDALCLLPQGHRCAASMGKATASKVRRAKR